MLRPAIGVRRWRLTPIQIIYLILPHFELLQSLPESYVTSLSYSPTLITEFCPPSYDRSSTTRRIQYNETADYQKASSSNILVVVVYVMLGLLGL